MHRIKKVNVYYAGLIVFASLVGMLISALLIKHNINPSASGMVSEFCGTGASSPCSVVNQSDWSKVLGMPIAFWGFIFYGSALLMGLFYWVLKEPFFIKKLFWMSIFALVVDLVLLAYSVFALEVVCPLCAVTYLASLLMLLGSFFELSNHKKEYGVWPKMNELKFINTKSWILFAALFLMLPATGWYMSTGDSPQALSAQEDPKLQKMFNDAFEDFYKKYKESPTFNVDAPSLPSKGPANAKVNIVVFADPLCPYCALYALKLNNLVKRYPDKAKVIFRSYPLDKNCNQAMKNQLHKGACELSYAMLCAGEQKKFWEMHDNLFMNQPKWSKGVSIAKLEETAQNLGLDKGQFSKCLKTNAIKAKVQADLKAGNAAEVTGTPTLFVNGHKLPGLRADFFDFFMNNLVEKESR